MTTFRIIQLFMVSIFIVGPSKCLNSQQQPNIIIIMADDLGWNDFGIHGSNQIPTPNIDSLGYNGVILDKFYTQQTCTPSRAALLTGKYPMRLGLQGTPIRVGENRSLPLDTPTMAERLKEIGYNTHLVGKWHLGQACEEHTPTKRGFDTHFGYWNGYVGYFSYEIDVANPLDNTKNFTGFDLRDGFKPQWALQGQYATELFTKKTLEVIDKHDTSKPLFLMLSHLAGHSGHAGIELGVPNITRTNELYGYIKSNERRSLADLVNIMDRSVGDVMKKLSERQMLKNSIVLFLSDNGAPTQGELQNFGSSWPYRGLKSTLFEGGVRGTGAIYSPLFNGKRYVNRQLIHISDFLPTFYHAAGGDVKNLGKIDGINQWDVISKNKTTSRREILLNFDENVKTGYSGILGYDGRYKLLNSSYKNGIYNDYFGESGRGPENPPYDIAAILKSETNIAIQKLNVAEPLKPETIEKTRKEVDVPSCRPENKTEPFLCKDLCLFDIYSDPCETSNLIEVEDKQKIVAELKARLENYKKQIVPATNRPVDPNSDPKKFNNTWSPWLECANYGNDVFGIFSYLSSVWF